jgi:hypothetical protein
MIKIGVGIFIGLVIGVVITLAVTSQSWLVASWRHNTSWEALQDWAGALSGWAAFAAAVLSLPYLIGQYREAQKQTRFTIGDDEPTLDVVQHMREQNRLVIRIVNWNRRAIFVRAINTATKLKPIDMAESIAIASVETSTGGSDRSMPIQIDGWEDRSARPHFARVDLLLLRRFEGTEPGWEADEVRPFPTDAVITVEVQKLGNVHSVYPISARAFPDEKLE